VVAGLSANLAERESFKVDVAPGLAQQLPGQLKEHVRPVRPDSPRPAVIPLACPVIYRCSALVQLHSRMLVAGRSSATPLFRGRRCDSVHGLAVITSCLPAAPS
jgi:hypothetical protein